MHNIQYETFDGSESTQFINSVVMDRIEHSVDGYGTDRITFIHDLMDNYDEAVAFLDKKSEGQFYPGYAVRYKRRSEEETPAVKLALSKLRKISKEHQEYAASHSVHVRISAFIGCPECGSRLANKRFTSEWCPVCRADLRPQSTKDKLAWYDTKIKEANEAVRNARNKTKPVSNDWLVRYEYHS